MSYFEDLSPFIYHVYKPNDEDGPVANAGWLHHGLPFTQGELSRELATKLSVLCAKPMRMMRGLRLVLVVHASFRCK